MFFFQLKRGETEVDNLFKVIEDITDIKDTEIDRFKQTVDQVLPQTNNELQQAIRVCERFADVEKKYKEVKMRFSYYFILFVCEITGCHGNCASLPIKALIFAPSLWKPKTTNHSFDFCTVSRATKTVFFYSVSNLCRFCGNMMNKFI